MKVGEKTRRGRRRGAQGEAQGEAHFFLSLSIGRGVVEQGGGEGVGEGMVRLHIYGFRYKQITVTKLLLPT